jgi:hypothetical protein
MSGPPPRESRGRRRRSSIARGMYMDCEIVLPRLPPDHQRMRCSARCVTHGLWEGCLATSRAQPQRWRMYRAHRDDAELVCVLSSRLHPRCTSRRVRLKENTPAKSEVTSKAAASIKKTSITKIRFVLGCFPTSGCSTSTVITPSSGCRYAMRIRYRKPRLNIQVKLNIGASLLRCSLLLTRCRALPKRPRPPQRRAGGIKMNPVPIWRDRAT